MAGKKKIRNLLKGVVTRQTAHYRRRPTQQTTRAIDEVTDNYTAPEVFEPTTSNRDLQTSNQEDSVAVEVIIAHSQPAEGIIEPGIVEADQVIFSTDEEIDLQLEPPKAKKMKKRKQTRLVPAPPLTASSASEGSDSESLSETSSEEINIQSEAEPILKMDDIKTFQGRSSKAKPLCPCTDMSAGDVTYMVLNLGLRHNLSWSAQVDILKMINTIFGGDKVPCSKYLYLKQFEQDTSSISSHIFCNKCEVYIGPKETVAINQSCKFCGTLINVKSTDNFFVSLSISSQFKSLTKDVDFVDKILNFKYKRQQTTGISRDILDGDVYKALSERGGILSSKYNFSYTFFTDGVRFGESSNKSIWPIYLTLNELPYEYRSKYLILAGLYVGPKDPSLKYFMKPFVAEANDLSREGIVWECEGKKITSLLIPLCCIADAPARSKLLNYQSYSAEYGCTFCYHKSKRASGGQRFLVSKEPAQLRSKESLQDDIVRLFEQRHLPDPADRVYRGVKGISPLMYLEYFDMNSNVVVDYMHAVALGVVKHHIHLICDSRYKKVWIGCENERMGIDHIIEAIDQRLLAIQSSSSIFRVLRPLKDRALWRASEFKAWIIFYALACLHGLMKPKYLHHLGLLSKATHMMLKKSLTSEEISEIHRLLERYSFYMQEYFGEGNMRYNVHLLSHIADGISKYGPVWTHNSFLYEAQNRYLRQMAKNPSLVILEIAKKFLVYKNIPLVCHKVVSSERAVTFSDNILHYKRVKNFIKFDTSCILLGVGNPTMPGEVQVILRSKNPQLAISNCKLYQRMVLRGTLFSTIFYSSGKQNNDSCAQTAEGYFIILRYIIHFGGSNVLLVVEKLKEARRSLFRNELTTLNHVRKFERSEQLECIPHEDLRNPCMLISVRSDLYVSPIPYGCTVE